MAEAGGTDLRRQETPEASTLVLCPGRSRGIGSLRLRHPAPPNLPSTTPTSYIPCEEGDPPRRVGSQCEVPEGLGRDPPLPEVEVGKGFRVEIDGVFVLYG